MGGIWSICVLTQLSVRRFVNGVQSRYLVSARLVMEKGVYLSSWDCGMGLK
jgi:hypothetical protein